jgi:predicted Zn-dependent protease
MNFFSKQQDIELGQQAAQEVAQQLDVVKDPFLQEYVNNIGRRLAASDDPAKSEFPFKFTVLNDPSINAFALPGGPMFVFTGLMNAVRTEGELAGVLGHEMAHVVLRHGTNQVSKANLLQIPAAVAQATMADGSAIGQLAQLGIGFGLSSLLLKFSRTAETQADKMGARIIAQAGYQPLEMAKFFETLEAGGGQRGPEFFSDHPNPGNRRKNIQAEADVMPAREYNFATGEFDQMKDALKRLPPPAKRPPQQQRQSLAQHDANWKPLEAGSLRLAYPANWVAVRAGNSNMIALAPKEGLARDIDGNVAVGYGVILSYYQPQRRNLMGATQELVQQLAATNPSLQQSSQPERIRVQGYPGLAVMFQSRSPFGGAEQDILITVARPEGLLYIMAAAPADYAGQMRQISQQLLQSLQFRN